MLTILPIDISTKPRGSNSEAGDSAPDVAEGGRIGKGLKYRLLARFVAAGALIKRVRGSRRGQSLEVHVAATQPRVRNPITITSTMPVEDILAQFVRSGCKDLTRQLETCQLSQHPVSNGGFGDIYRGTLPNGQQVGLKCLRLQVGASEDDKRHLRRAAQELHVWSKCEHPHILQLLGVAKHQGRIAMVSPWMENGDLRWFLSQRPKVNRCALCIQISEAVVYLHESNIVHGDIKGANIVMAQDYIAKLTDFGSATIKASSLRLVGSSSTTNPAVSIRWAAPELVEGVTKCTPEGDIYALGMTFLEVITGSVPYAGFRDIAVLNKIINKIHPERPVDYIPIDHQHTDLLWSLLKSCWAYNPSDRPAASGVRGELLQIAQAELADPALHDAPGSLRLLGGSATVSTTRVQPPAAGKLEVQRLQAGVTGDGKKLLKHTAHEIYVWSKCRHANILPLIGVAQYNGRLAMISPWVEHNDLILFLSQQRSSQANRLRLCTQVADAMAYLHNIGIVHGDIKASSVLLSHDITVKLAGFGNMALRDYSLAFTPTAYGLGISAPEIIEGKTRLSAEADIYALGMVGQATDAWVQARASIDDGSSTGTPASTNCGGLSEMCTVYYVRNVKQVNQVVDAVAYLHEQNIVHGDIRASNILVSKDDTAMLTGFETVALEEQSLAFTTTTTSSTGVWAPVRWAAPEVLDGLISRSTESDIYSLGMTILVLI
ncbi:unnamed protein product [Rhizoctonia solani]|uniref:Protein kinase domain-containing protein n=1 Tax=Rhizoctonia solani TaxID=456999 RepID=A0A8H3CIV7_9AGAM|nr:unnamed protein product [Rhizoctonia solani]